MEWQRDNRRGKYVRKITTTISELVGRFTEPSERTLDSTPVLIPLIDLFVKFGQKDWEYAPGCLRLTEGKVKKFPAEVLNWAIDEGLIIAIERNGTPFAYRISESWQDWLICHASSQVENMKLDWSYLNRVYDRYGQLGLRVASHLAFGNSHALDNIVIPDPFRSMVWTYSDPIAKGASVVRAGGMIHIETPFTSHLPKWNVPGHYLWPWEVETIQIEKFEVGQRILLIENPYVYWHILQKITDKDTLLVCLHGETRQPGLLREDASLNYFLRCIVNRNPNAVIQIWCDPDPGGLVMASNAYETIQKLGGNSTFLMMNSNTLEMIEELVVFPSKLQPLDDSDLQTLKSAQLHPDLQGLALEITRRGLKGEQEGLSIRISGY
jgi:hypothetical protein